MDANGDPPRPTGSGRHEQITGDPHATHNGRWRRRNAGGKADIADQFLANTRFEVSAAAVQRKEADSWGLRQHVLAPFELAAGCEPHYPGRRKTRLPNMG